MMLSDTDDDSPMPAARAKSVITGRIPPQALAKAAAGLHHSPRPLKQLSNGQRPRAKEALSKAELLMRAQRVERMAAALHNDVDATHAPAPAPVSVGVKKTAKSRRLQPSPLAMVTPKVATSRRPPTAPKEAFDREQEGEHPSRDGEFDDDEGEAAEEEGEEEAEEAEEEEGEGEVGEEEEVPAPAPARAPAPAPAPAPAQEYEMAVGAADDDDDDDEEIMENRARVAAERWTRAAAPSGLPARSSRPGPHGRLMAAETPAAVSEEEDHLGVSSHLASLASLAAVPEGTSEERAAALQAALAAAVSSITMVEQRQRAALLSSVDSLKSDFRSRLEALETEFVRRAEGLSAELAGHVAEAKRECVEAVAQHAEQLSVTILAIRGDDGLVPPPPRTVSARGRQERGLGSVARADAAMDAAYPLDAYPMEEAPPAEAWPEEKEGEEEEEEEEEEEAFHEVTTRESRRPLLGGSRSYLRAGHRAAVAPSVIEALGSHLAAARAGQRDEPTSAGGAEARRAARLEAGIDDWTSTSAVARQVARARDTSVRRHHDRSWGGRGESH